MKRPFLMRTIFSLMVGAGLILLPSVSKGAVDTYTGDTEIYGQASGTYQPNVLFLVDDSGSMGQPPPNSPPDYDHTVTYGAENVCYALNGNDLIKYRFAALDVPPEVAESKVVEQKPLSSVSSVSPKVMSSLTYRSGGHQTASAVRSSSDGKPFSFVSAIWDGVAPNFIQVATYSISGNISFPNSIPVSGVTVTVTGTGGPYSAMTDSAGNYTVIVAGAATYSLTVPSLSGYTFSPSTSQSITLSSGSKTSAGNDFTATRTCGSSYCISGNISDASGNFLSGIAVQVQGNSLTYNTTTDSHGNYIVSGLSGNAVNGILYTITPSSSSYAFTFTGSGNNPTHIFAADKTGKDFTATPICTTNCSISGTITKASNGNALSGVTVKVFFGTTYQGIATTNSSGDYTVSGLAANQTYTVYPSFFGQNYSFSPVSRTVTINQSDITGRDFTASTSVFSIKGSVQTSGGTGVTATITATDVSGNTYPANSSSTGAYTISNVPNGTYTLTTSNVQSGYTISPNWTGSPTVTVNGSNATNKDYDATGGGSGSTTYQISGNVKDSSNSNVKNANVTITDAGGSVVGTDTTDNSGNYSVNGLPNGTYTISVTKSGHVFTNQTVTISSGSVTVNFKESSSGGSGGGTTLGACGSQNIYKFTASGGGSFSLSGTYNIWGNMSNGIAGNCTAAYDALRLTGIWVGTLSSSSGTCFSNDQAGTYFLGNYLNWSNQTVAKPSGSSKMSIAISTVQNLINNTNNVRMGLMTFDSGSKGGTFVSLTNGYTSYVANMTTVAYGSVTNKVNLVNAVGKLSASTMTPLGGALYEAMLYFKGKSSWVTSGLNYTSPIQNGCQTNYVIVVTDGMSTSDTAMVPTSTTGFGAYCAYGDCDGDKASNNNELYILGMDPGSGSDYMDDVAYYMHNHDMVNYPTEGTNSTVNGANMSYPGSKVSVFTVGFALDPADLNDLQGIALLTETATNGGGQFVNVKNAASLATTLSTIVGSILQIDTSFVAPVVPVSPANRTYSGNSVYVGLFLPQTTGFWYGNLKKFGYVNGQVVDVTGQPATSTTGAFNSTSKSVWDPTNVQDGGSVKEGGVGAVLYNQTPAKRNLFTYLGSSGYLTSSSNAFTIGNTALTPTKLGFNSGVALTDASNLTSTVNYVWGYDTGGSAERTWILGDVLHSEPAVVNYGNNLSVVYVGSNDGMLHAFADVNPLNYNCDITTWKDTAGNTMTLKNQISPTGTNPCPSGFSAPQTTFPLGSSNTVSVMDGQELWGFVPPDILPNLASLTSSAHGYGVDGSPAIYYLDANNDGQITVPTGCTTIPRPSGCDQVLLVFGERRGGHAYWALDVTDPNNPVAVWHADNANTYNATTVIPELGESFSLPQIAPVNIGGASTQAVFIGGGYDNTNEDKNINPNYSTTTGFQYTDTVGRGVYALDLQSGSFVWSWAYNSTRVTNNPTYSIPSDVTVLDSNNNGVIDTIYVGDVGGQLWKFDVSNTTPSNWTGKILFQSNPGNDGSKGRKIFYPPDVTYESGYQALFLGTGDREHPLSNTNVATIPVDRIYSVFDKPTYTGISKEGGTTISTCNASTPLLLDVTTNVTPTINCAGWYIRLDTTVTSHLAGEKVLSAPLVLNKEVTFTTYAPLLVSTTVTSSCGNTSGLGTGFVWSLKYDTGGSYFNYNGATDQSGRYSSLGSGIPSGVVVTVTATGMNGLVGVGGGIEGVNLATGTNLNIIYWHQPY